MTKPPDRRVSLVADRRRGGRGGRRCTDYGWSSPPSLVACAECPTGAADLVETSSAADPSAVTYRCRDCGRSFERVAALS
jgi:hypothetical protein